MRALAPVLFLTLAATAVACAEDDRASPAGAAGSAGLGSGTGGGGGTVADPGGAGAGEGGAISSQAGAAGSASERTSPPADAAAVNAFLQTRTYRAWPQETKDHVSKGPHGGTVKVFLNPTIDASFAAGNASHPAGSITVKELYQDGKPSGFAYSAKLADDSAGGDNWYWYEVFTDAPASTAPYAGKGIGLCKNCHSAGGRDFVLIEYPLQ